jgi:hypothetical protein
MNFAKAIHKNQDVVAMKYVRSILILASKEELLVVHIQNVQDNMIVEMDTVEMIFMKHVHQDQSVQVVSTVEIGIL